MAVEKNIANNTQITNKHGDKTMSLKLSSRIFQLWTLIISLVILSITSCSFLHKNNNYHSKVLLIDVAPDSRSTKIFDLTENESKQISEDPDLAVIGWSPLGSLILFDGLVNKAGQIWASKGDGTALKKIFEAKDYPSIEQYFSYDKYTHRSHKSYWLSENLIIINANKKIILFDLDKKEVRSVTNGQINYISIEGGFWIEEETIANPNITLVFLSGERFSIPRNAYHPSPDGKKVLYVQEQNGNRLLYVANINKQKGLYGEKAIVTLPSTASFPKWSPSSEYLLYPIPNSNENEPPFYGLCVVISAADGQEVYNDRCDYGGGFLTWSPDENSNEFGALTYDKKFVIYNIKTKDKKTLDIFSLDLPAESTRQLVDWQMIEVP